MIIKGIKTVFLHVERNNYQVCNCRYFHDIRVLEREDSTPYFCVFFKTIYSLVQTDFFSRTSLKFSVIIRGKG